MKNLRTGLVALAALAAACGGDKGNGGNAGGSAAGGKVTLNGAGATFPAPIYTKWFGDYAAAHPVQVNYQAIGSGGGIQQVTAKTVDFGASDAPMKAEEEAKAPGILQLPTVMGAVVVTYNLPGVTQPLKLDGALLADVFAGRVAKWNDPRIAALNPGVTLPGSPIAVVHRSDGSGTTFVFTDYLSKVSPEWKSSVGADKSVKWPVGLGAKGNEGVAGGVKQTRGAIGYVELAYAVQNHLPMASLKNADGQFVAPSVDATAAAAAGAAQQVRNGDFRVSLNNAPGAATYPIATWTYLLVPAHWDDCGKANAFAGLFGWALTQGSDAAKQLDYAPLPDQVRQGVLQQLARVTCGAQNTPVATGA